MLVIFSFPVQGNSANTYQQELINELHKQLTKTVGNRKQLVLDRSRLRIFYESRNFQPVWLDYKGPLPRAAVLRQVLNAAGDEGLEYEIYHPDKITALWRKRLPWNLAELELLLSDALLRYLPQPEVDALRVLDNLLKTNDLMAILLELAPDHEGYRRLRNALKYYREIELQGGWSPIPPGPALQLGVWHEHVSLLRERLVAEGDLELGPVTHVNYYDQAIKFAVERFQVRYGLKLDGVVGAGTRAAMNVPVSERIEQIKLNMERWRWLPRKLGQRYIMVNTAGYELAVVDNNKTAFIMDVMVGTPKRPTPIAKGRLHTIVLNPYWTLPETIIYEDIIPRQIRNKNYIKSKGIRVFSNLSRGKEIDPAKVDWTEIKPGHFPYVLRQDPGKKNPLGRIKFLFSNVHDVYLHDTPKQSLFDKDNRAFSSGCVRVARPMQLASYLLDDKNDWSEAEIKESIDAGEYRKIPVSGRIPVYLVYITAWVGENNGVHFRPDIYQWDPKVAKCDEFP